MFKFNKRKKEDLEKKIITVTVNDEATGEELDVYDIEVKPEEVKVVEIDLKDMENMKEDYFDMDFKTSLKDMYKDMDKKTFQKHIMDACSSYTKDGSKVLTDEEKIAAKVLEDAAEAKALKEKKVIADLLVGDAAEFKKKQGVILKDEADLKKEQDEINKKMQEYYDNA